MKKTEVDTGAPGNNVGSNADNNGSKPPKDNSGCLLGIIEIIFEFIGGFFD